MAGLKSPDCRWPCPINVSGLKMDEGIKKIRTNYFVI